MKRFLPIFICSILCIGLYAQDRNPRRIEFPETDSLVYIHQKLNDSNIKIYGDIVDGTQYGGDVVNGKDWFKINVVDKNKEIKVARDEKGLFVNVSTVPDSCTVILYTAKPSASGKSFDKGDEFRLTLVKIKNPLKNNTPNESVQAESNNVTTNQILNVKSPESEGNKVSVKSGKLAPYMPTFIIAVILVIFLFVGYIYFRVARLAAEYKQIQAKVSKEAIISILDRREVKTILQKEIIAELDKRLAQINTQSPQININIDEIKESLVNSLEFRKKLQDIVTSGNQQVAPVSKVNVEPSSKFLRNDVTFDPSSNSFYPDSLSQHLFDIYEKGGQLYYTLTKDEVIRRTLISGISYYDGCLKIEENTGYQMVVPIEDGKLNLVADRYYVDTNNKLKVKIV